MKSMTKSELAIAAGVSMRTFSRWLSNNRDLTEEAGITKKTRLLNPRQVRLVCEFYGIDVES